MPKVVREENNDNLTAVLTIQIDKADYSPKFKAELQRRAKNNRLKGFRQGQTAYPTLVKLYGKEALPVVVENMLKEEIDNHIKENDLKLFGSVLPHADYTLPKYDHKNLNDYEFKFDIAYFPEFELKGLSKEDTYKRYDIEISDEDVAETVENIKKEAANSISVTEDIEDNDIIRLKVQELEDGAIKEGGMTGEFPILVNMMADEAVKAEMLTQKQGDTIRLNIFKLEEAKTDNHANFVRKNYLGLKEDDITDVGEEFEATITEVKRLEPVEMDQAFYDKIFGPGAVHNEEEMVEKIKSATKNAYAAQLDDLLFNDIQAKVIELNQFDLPEDFLLRWYKGQQGNETAKVDGKELVAGMHWSLLRNRIIDQFKIKITEEDVKAAAYNMMMQYMGYADPAMMDQLMKNKETVNKFSEDALNKKVIMTSIGAVTVENKAISLQDYQQMLKELQEAHQSKAKALAADENEEA